MCIVLLIPFIPPPQRVAAYLLSPTKSEKISSFFIANTTEKESLDIYLPLSTIGATYNFTITVHSNSSSGIIVSILHVHVREGPIWEGPSELRLEPGRTVTVSYISHFTSWCGTDSTTYFHYGLLKSSKNASGTYQLVNVHPGYPVGEPIPFHLYVSDISLWVERRSNIYGTPELAVGVFLLCIGILVVISWLRRQLTRNILNDKELKTNKHNLFNQKDKNRIS
ncbi:MAG: hypothetical protein ACFE95_19570 [Candidatus Hodarchaeota archaeon]